jgi:glycolate oxidase FAD binding subunit
VGGALAVNSWGPEQLGLGTPRDYTIGLRVVTPDGRITRAGGKVVKNVAGYDLCKLYIGSLGTLGLIVEATFTLRPQAIAQSFVSITSRDVGPLCSLTDTLIRKGTSVRASWIIYDRATEQSDTYYLKLLVTGAELAVERSIGEITSAAADGSLQASVSSDSHSPAAGMNWASTPRAEAQGLSCRVTSLPQEVAALTSSLAKLEPRTMRALPSAGTIIVQWPGIEHDAARERLAEIRGLINSFDALVTVISCPPGLKRDIDVFGDLPPSFELMRSVKQQFDPNGILSPGRFVGKL